MYEVRFRAGVDKTGPAVGRVTEDRAARDTLESVRLVTKCLAGPGVVQAPRYVARVRACRVFVCKHQQRGTVCVRRDLTVFAGSSYKDRVMAFTTWYAAPEALAAFSPPSRRHDLSSRRW